MRVQGKEEEREMSLGTSRCPIPPPPPHPGGEEFRSAPIQPVKGRGFSQIRGVSHFVVQLGQQGDINLLSHFCYKSQRAFVGRDQCFISVMLQISKCLCNGQPFISVMLQISKCFCRERSMFYFSDATNLKVLLQGEINVLFQ